MKAEENLIGIKLLIIADLQERAMNQPLEIAPTQMSPAKLPDHSELSENSAMIREIGRIM